MKKSAALMPYFCDYVQHFSGNVGAQLFVSIYALRKKGGEQFQFSKNVAAQRKVTCGSNLSCIIRAHDPFSNQEIRRDFSWFITNEVTASQQVEMSFAHPWATCFLQRPDPNHAQNGNICMTYPGFCLLSFRSESPVTR
jgi:hypothetical protein